MDVDTRVLRYFVAVAEQLSFTQAAKALFVSQPSLSRQIRQLEDRLGTELFVRGRTEIRLTRTGEVLLPAARRQLAEWEQTTRIVRTTAAAENNVLRVGFAATGGGSLGRRACAAFLARHPHVTVEPKRFDWGGEADALRQGLVDVAFLWLPADTTGLHTAVAATEPRVVVMSTSHPLASRTSLTIADLLDEPVLWTRWSVHPRPAGSPPPGSQENDNLEETLDQAASTGAICVCPASMATQHTHPDLVWRPLADAEPLRIAMAWPKTSPNPLVPPFVHAIRSLPPPDPGRPRPPGVLS